MNQQQQARSSVQLQAAAGAISPHQLQWMLTTYEQSFAYMIVANSEMRHFKPFNLAEAIDVSQWTEGQVFGPQGELRWRRKGVLFAVCLLAEALPNLPDCLPTRQTASLNRDEVLVRLWGEHTETDRDAEGQSFWMEGQIPRLLYYPIVDAPARVALNVVQYLQNDGTVEFIRFAGLEAW